MGHSLVWDGLFYQGGEGAELGVWMLVGETRDPSTWTVWLPVLGVVSWARLGSCCDVDLVYLSTSPVPF